MVSPFDNGFTRQVTAHRMLPRNYQHSSHFTLVSGGVELHATSPLAERWLEPLIREFRFVSLCTIEAPGERVIDTVIRHRQSP